MRKAVAAVLDFASGIALVVAAFLEARVLLQSRPLLYLAFPVICTVAFLIGSWRGRQRILPLGLTAVLAAAPLFMLAGAFFSGRNKPLMIFPIVAFVFILLGGMMTRLKTAVVFLIAANVVAAFAGPLFIGWILPRRQVTEKAVPFQIHLVNGQRISSQQLRGRVVVLDFWATWCVPCQHELPTVQRVYDKTRNDAAFYAIDGVTTDQGEGGDTAERAIEYFRRGGYSIPLAWDEHAVLEKSLAVTGYPTLLVLDPEGQVRMRHVGFMGSEDLEGVLMRTIDEVKRR